MLLFYPGISIDRYMDMAERFVNVLLERAVGLSLIEKPRGGVLR
jgi:hypothetical protein